ncbi:hypothetical protein BTEBP_170009 [Brochothrix thermosphacta]|nr:hypothetical protein BTEBP_170009 [Brochothrix thermosphacta]
MLSVKQVGIERKNKNFIQKIDNEITDSSILTILKFFITFI